MQSSLGAAGAQRPDDVNGVVPALRRVLTDRDLALKVSVQAMNLGREWADKGWVEIHNRQRSFAPGRTGVSQWRGVGAMALRHRGNLAALTTELEQTLRKGLRRSYWNVVPPLSRDWREGNRLPPGSLADSILGCLTKTAATPTGGNVLATLALYHGAQRMSVLLQKEKGDGK